MNLNEGMGGVEGAEGAEGVRGAGGGGGVRRMGGWGDLVRSPGGGGRGRGCLWRVGRAGVSSGVWGFGVDGWLVGWLVVGWVGVKLGGSRWGGYGGCFDGLGSGGWEYAIEGVYVWVYEDMTAFVRVAVCLWCGK